MIHLTKILFFLSLFTLFLQGNNFKNIQTFEADFIQTITNQSGKNAIYTGEIHIKEPNLIKWQYKEPIIKFVYIKKFTVTIIEPELEQVILTKLNKEINILTLLKNAREISSNKYISNFNNIDYTLELKENMLKAITYKDELENNVSIDFTNVKQNTPMDDQIFKFIIPQEYDLIKK